MSGRVALFRAEGDLEHAIKKALEGIGLNIRLLSGRSVALKPNLTYPYHVPGVTTSPSFIRATVKILVECASRVAVVETDGGYGGWRADEAFSGHELFSLQKEFGIEIVNLNSEPRELISFRRRGRTKSLYLPSRLLHLTDTFISMPVPKIHSMTRLSLAFKNQWGCVPDVMRLRSHYMFDEAITTINRALRPVVLADGTYFLDNNGPMNGTPLKMDLVIAASDPGSFDRYVAELMGVPWKRVSHLRKAAKTGDMPAGLDKVDFNVPPEAVRKHVFVLKRTLRNYIALFGFKSRFVTWLGYESWFGRIVLHGILYAFTNKSVKSEFERSREP